ncbi:hypothetical protein BJY16_004266 [Actinoplanes octamycinicus]|uniref:Uncharacterized protein n=2 Tax=Actinoplanes octamycinicus TaxID=135948 RepID=A0A7W7M8C6_9ACTN|nr:hypothetical protein [Actinoplanes octamycinicus]MBB4740807.1 hypothetical protein [Actinoplanes octamycinicus]
MKILDGDVGVGIAMKKVLGWVLLFLLVFWIGTSPGPAADVARSIWDGITNIFTNIGTFFVELANG